MSALKILVIPGSLRTGSHNAKLAAAAAYQLAQAGVEVTRLSLADFPLPIYDGDLQSKSGVPKNAVNLKRMIGAHHGVLMVTPEYNSSVPPLLKNAIDWASRPTPATAALANKPVAVLGASTGMFGAAWAQSELRKSLGLAGARVLDHEVAVPSAHEAFHEDGRLNRGGTRKRIREVLADLLEAVNRRAAAQAQPG